MKYKGTLVVVKSCAPAPDFYRNVPGLELVRDNDGNLSKSAHRCKAEIQICTEEQIN